MRVLLQRVSKAAVITDGEEIARIGPGLLIFLGIETADTDEDVAWLVGKISSMRIFNDLDGKMNLAVTEADGNVLVVSQFTLHASTRKGNRPSFIRAARPEASEPLYHLFCRAMETRLDREVATGRFGADMRVELVNDGPVTIFIDSRARE